jgi:DNA-binding transcriptional MerR regulator
MKKQRTRIFGSLMVAILMATIGTVLVSAETENADETEDLHLPFHGKENLLKHRTLNDELTDEQQAEIDALITILNEEGASNEEIREAISAKLDELGILDERLENAIEQTEQRLEILNRENELRDQGYSWEEINQIIQEEYVLEHPSDIYYGLNPGIYNNT